jgi:hypothetical protein
LTPAAIRAHTVLWETQRGEVDKVGFLRHKAPVLAENTYSFGSDTTSWFSSFAQTFSYLDGRFSALINSFEILETGLTDDLADLLREDRETSMDPILSFSDMLQLVLIKNRPDIDVRYTLGTVTLDSTGEKIASDGSIVNSSSPAFPHGPDGLSFSATSSELGEHGYLVLHVQAFDSASVRKTPFCAPWIPHRNDHLPRKGGAQEIAGTLK